MHYDMLMSTDLVAHLNESEGESPERWLLEQAVKTARRDGKVHIDELASNGTLVRYRVTFGDPISHAETGAPETRSA